MIAADKFTLTICALFCAAPEIIIALYAVGCTLRRAVRGNAFYYKNRKDNPSPAPSDTSKKPF